MVKIEEKQLVPSVAKLWLHMRDDCIKDRRLIDDLPTPLAFGLIADYARVTRNLQMQSAPDIDPTISGTKNKSPNAVCIGAFFQCQVSAG